jgi:hypothetical protein
MTKEATVRKKNLLALKKEHCGRVEVTQKCPFMTTLRGRHNAAHKHHHYGSCMSLMQLMQVAGKNNIQVVYMHKR